MPPRPSRSQARNPRILLQARDAEKAGDGVALAALLDVVEPPRNIQAVLARIKRLRDPRSAPGVLAYLEAETRPRPRGECIRALDEMGVEHGSHEAETLSILARRLAHRSYSTRSAAYRALSERTDSGARDVRHAWLRDGDIPTTDFWDRVREGKKARDPDLLIALLSPRRSEHLVVGALKALGKVGAAADALGVSAYLRRDPRVAVQLYGRRALDAVRDR